MDRGESWVRWTTAGIGWSLAALSLLLPSFFCPQGLWVLYPKYFSDVRGLLHIRASVQFSVHFGPAVTILVYVFLLGFVSAGCALVASPLLVALNHAVAQRLRRCRWTGLTLLGVAVLELVPAAGDDLPVHMLVAAHTLVAVAVLPWPCRSTRFRGFPVEPVLR